MPDNVQLPAGSGGDTIAGRWLIEKAISGVFAGAVTIAAKDPNVELTGAIDADANLAGRAEREVAIKGMRKRT